MTIATYDELVAAIIEQMDDASLSAHAALFIQLAESSFKRRLDVLESEGDAAITINAASHPFPADYKAAISLTIDGEQPLGLLSDTDLRTIWADGATGTPEAYAVRNGSFVFGPAPDAAYPATLVYLRKLAPLSTDNQSNWLLEAHPDLYLYGSLVHAEFRGWNDARLPLLNSATEGMIIEINRDNARKKRADLIDSVPAEYF